MSAVFASGSVATSTHVELAELVAEYCARTDRIVDRPGTDLFTADGRMRVAALERDGRDAIAAYFTARRAQEEETGRKTRHFVSNFMVESAEGDLARVRFLCLVFAGVGAVPLPSALPATIADFSADCVRSTAGAWLFQELRAAVIFTGAGAAPFAR